jgi:DNA-binding transcriptional MerR regulator
MEYRVEEIARAAGVSVDTVRFYQSRGLLPPPERRGRTAIYSDQHLDTLRQIRALNRQGLTLEAVGRLLAGEAESDGIKASLLGEGEPALTRADLARRAGVPEFLLESGEQAGLLQPLEIDGEARYTESDLRSVEAATLLLRSGFPLQELLPLARDHATYTQEIADRGIELFDRYVRKAGEEEAPPSRDDIARTFRELLPAVTALVALHFERTLTHRARARLARAGEEDALEAALAETQGPRLKLSWS